MISENYDENFRLLILSFDVVRLTKVHLVSAARALAAILSLDLMMN